MAFLHQLILITITKPIPTAADLDRTGYTDARRLLVLLNGLKHTLMEEIEL